MRDFYVTSTECMINKFALVDERLKNTSVVDVAKRQTSKFSQLQYFLDRYPVLVEASGGDQDGIQEFLLYQVDEEVRTQEKADNT